MGKKKHIIQIGGTTYDLSNPDDRARLERDQDAKVTNDGSSVHMPDGHVVNVARGSVDGTVIQAGDIHGGIEF